MCLTKHHHTWIHWVLISSTSYILTWGGNQRTGVISLLPPDLVIWIYKYVHRAHGIHVSQINILIWESQKKQTFLLILSLEMFSFPLTFTLFSSHWSELMNIDKVSSGCDPSIIRSIIAIGAPYINNIAFVILVYDVLWAMFDL